MKLKAWVARDDKGPTTAFTKKPVHADSSPDSLLHHYRGRDREWFLLEEDGRALTLPARANRELKLKPGECIPVTITIKRRKT